MDTLIIYCHPYPQSFNHAILQAVQNNLQSKNIEFTPIDLYAERFSPVYTKKDLSLFHTGKTPVACSKARALRDAPLSLRQALPKTSPGLCRQNRDAAQTPGGLPDE